MIRSLYFTPDGQLHTDLDQAGISKALSDPDGLLWVDFQATAVEDDYPILSDTFGFHPLAVDDALQESHVPKLDDWGEYLYIVLHGVVFEHHSSAYLDTLELDVFLGKNHIVTHHDLEISAIDRVWSSVQRDDRHLRYGADHLLYRIADEVVASYMPVVEEIDDEVDLIEDRVFGDPSPQLLEKIFAIKRAVIRLRRIIGPQREVLNKLARDDFRVVDGRAQVYFRDVYDHLVRMQDISESLRDLISGALDTYLSVINNRMNEIMRTLTVITTLFMPISFVTSFFGMNYFLPRIPQTGWMEPFVFTLVLLLILLAPVGMFTWIRRRGWM